MYYTMSRGLGAVSNNPPPRVAGYEWYRIFQKTAAGVDIPTHQASYCPSPAPYGCTVYQGYAWAQIQAAPSELQAKARTAELKAFCDSAFATWVSGNPLLAACLDASDRQNYDQLCAAAATGQIDASTASAKWTEYALARCKAQCLKGYEAWRAASPQAVCVPVDEGRTKFRHLCMQAMRGELSPDGVRKRWNDYVASRCPQQPAPPNGGAPLPPSLPPSPSSTTPTPPPSDFSSPPADYAPPSGTVDIPADEGRQPPLEEEPPPEAALLRRVGPIVGIGLVVAVGLTLYRMRKKGGKRKRARRG